MIFMMVIGLFTSRVILDSLGVEDYGIYNVVGGFVTMFNVFCSGLSSATQRFITYDLGRGDEKELNKTFSTCIIIYLMIAAVILLLSEIGGIWFLENKMTIPQERLIAARWTFQLSLLTLIIGLISTPYNALIVSHEKMKAFAYISIFEAIAKLGIAFSIYYTSYDKLIVYAVALCMVQIVIRILYGAYCKRNFNESKFRFHFDWGRIKSIYSFTGWAMFGGLANLGFTQGLNILLNMFFNPVVNATRGIAVQVQQIINNFVVNFQTAVNPQIIKSYARDDKDYMMKLIFASSKFSFLLIFFVSLPVLIETDQLLALWLKDVPDYTTIFFRLILVTTIIDGISNPFMRSVDATGNIKKYQIIVGGTLLMIVPVSYVVLKMGGTPYSVFIVHIVLGLVAFGFRLYLAQSLVNIPIRDYLINVLIRIILMACISSILPLLIYYAMDTTLYRLLFVCIASVASVGICSWFICLLPNEKTFVVSKVHNLIDRIKKHD